MFGVLAYTSLKTLLSKVSLSGETLFMPGGRQSPKMASVDSSAGEHHAIHQEMEFSLPLPCISAGLVTGFVGILSLLLFNFGPVLKKRLLIHITFSLNLAP